jgi:hypothetical protein
LPLAERGRQQVAVRGKTTLPAPMNAIFATRAGWHDLRRDPGLARIGHRA